MLRSVAGGHIQMGCSGEHQSISLPCNASSSSPSLDRTRVRYIVGSEVLSVVD